ncbi:MAG: hypothetical protein ABFD25_15390 [Clostridiaceae bacterium]
MKLPGRYILLKILSTAAIVSFAYAGAVTLRTVFFRDDGGLLSLSFFILIILAGHLAGWYFWSKTPKFALRLAGSKFTRFLYFMLHVKNGMYFTAAVAAWSAMVLPLLATLLIYGTDDLLRTLFEVLLSILAYMMALKYSKMSSTQILHKKRVYTGFAVLAACLEATYFMKDLAYLRPWMFAVSYFFILAFLITKNQEDIDSNIFDKKHVEKSILPRNLRRFNTLSVCTVFLVILLFFNFKKVVVYTLKITAKLIFMIIEGVLWLMSFLFPSQQGTSQNGGSSGTMDFLGKSIELINPIINLIENTIKYFVILYISYKLISFLLKKLPGFLRKVADWIKRLLSIKNGEGLLETADYSDETERVKPVRERRLHNEMKKKIKKSKKDLKSVSDPVERVRYMYSSILHMLPLVGVRQEPSDTTLELIVKTRSAVVVKGLSPFTGIYNQVRYGGKIPDDGMLKEAEAHYEKVTEATDVK